MKGKKHISTLLTSLFICSSFFTNAQGVQNSLYIEGANSTKKIESGNVSIEGSTGKKDKPLNGFVITNDTTKVTIGQGSEPDSGQGGGSDTETQIKTGVVTAAEGLNVRTGPSSSYDKIGALSYRDTVQIYDTKNGWHKIKYGSGYGYVSGDYVAINGDTTNPPNPPKPSGTIKKVVVDPGHGGSDPGAIGPSGLREKDVVLDVSLKVRDMLKSKGYTVVMTRETDKYLTLQERVDISNSSKADFFVSVHANSFSNPSSNGTETFSYSSTGMGASVAKLMQDELVKSLGLTNRGFKTEGFYVLRNNKIPPALVELAFISNPKEESLLATDAFKTKCAKAIVDGIGRYN